jgi:hypothetical protein
MTFAELLMVFDWKAWRLRRELRAVARARWVISKTRSDSCAQRWIKPERENPAGVEARSTRSSCRRIARRSAVATTIERDLRDHQRGGRAATPMMPVADPRPASCNPLISEVSVRNNAGTGAKK